MTKLEPYDVVIIAPDFEDVEVRGKLGHVIGEVTEDGIAVFVYDLQRVWCLHPSDVTATGGRDVDAETNRGSPIRVNSQGEIIS
ncbi:hypothetical protein DLM45_15090 [Hyphomicrobium methylovorum]|uniref:hypothetical protein n=1 Tax=Hyphomicrobium methylovorum TaxID=84 RepID=UPI0015E69E66|nr:hypothetical protein [Hyphomicrobium methylovorum]MBA2127537.1 hypothetical protein [Hyphomicrobium methylovorum]